MLNNNFNAKASYKIYPATGSRCGSAEDDINNNQKIPGLIPSLPGNLSKPYLFSSPVKP
jgi:hypothetical protein